MEVVTVWVWSVGGGKQWMEGGTLRSLSLDGDRQRLQMVYILWESLSGRTDYVKVGTVWIRHW